MKRISYCRISWLYKIGCCFRAANRTIKIRIRRYDSIHRRLEALCLFTHERFDRFYRRDITERWGKAFIPFPSKVPFFPVRAPNKLLPVSLPLLYEKFCSKYREGIIFKTKSPEEEIFACWEYFKPTLNWKMKPCRLIHCDFVQIFVCYNLSSIEKTSIPFSFLNFFFL